MASTTCKTCGSDLVGIGAFVICPPCVTREDHLRESGENPAPTTYFYVAVQELKGTNPRKELVLEEGKFLTRSQKAARDMYSTSLFRHLPAGKVWRIYRFDSEKLGRLGYNEYSRHPTVAGTTKSMVVGLPVEFVGDI